MLNKSNGNMYPWVTHTWNPVKGKCGHECLYCYMKSFPQKELRFDGKTMEDDLGVNNVIFVGSSTDMWAENVPDSWIKTVLAYTNQFHNTYLFQTKNPSRFAWPWPFYSESIFGVTIESNRPWNGSKAPCPVDRWLAMSKLQCRKMVSIEPVMDFDLTVMVEWMKSIRPEFVSIGADSKNSHLPEPPAWKILNLIEELKAFTQVKLKDNLRRIVEVKA